MSLYAQLMPYLYQPHTWYTILVLGLIILMSYYLPEYKEYSFWIIFAMIVLGSVLGYYPSYVAIISGVVVFIIYPVSLKLPSKSGK
jgi:hypothetical protein